MVISQILPLEPSGSQNMVGSSYVSYKRHLQRKLKKHTVALAEDKGLVEVQIMEIHLN